MIDILQDCTLHVLTDDPTCMTKEEYFAMLDRSEAQYARGEYTTQLPGESVTDMLRRSGHYEDK